MPLLPTTPFLLAAVLISAKSSLSLYRKIMKNEYLSQFVRNYQEHCGVPKATIIKALIFLWISLGIGVIFAQTFWVQIVLLVFGLGVSIHLLSLKRSNRDEVKFTLIELLVSLGIIAVLASLILSVVDRSRKLAYKTLCMNNLAQIGTAIQLYSNDNNEMIPALSEGFYGSTMVVKMMNLPIGLGRIIGDYGTVAENYGCPLNSRNNGQSVKSSWENSPVSQIAYFYRYNDVGFNERLSSAQNTEKAMVMDFCCVGSSSIIAHNFEDVNVLYSDGSVFRRTNSDTPNKLYTVSAVYKNGHLQQESEMAWKNADESL